MIGIGYDTKCVLSAVSGASAIHILLIATLLTMPQVEPQMNVESFFEVVEFREDSVPAELPAKTEVVEVLQQPEAVITEPEPIAQPVPEPIPEPVDVVDDAIKEPLPEPIEPIIEEVAKSLPEPPAPEVLTETTTLIEQPQVDTVATTSVSEQVVEKTDHAMNDFVSTDLDAAYRNNPPPRYPLIAKRRRYEGIVLLEVSLDAEGYPSQVEIKKSSGFEILDDSALAAVLEWRFEPARQGGRPVKSVVEVPLRFALR